MQNWMWLLDDLWSGPSAVMANPGIVNREWPTVGGVIHPSEDVPVVCGPLFGKRSIPAGILPPA